MKKTIPTEEFPAILSRTINLLGEALAELRFRGCPDEHPLILRTREMVSLLQGMELGISSQNPGILQSGEPLARTPKKLHWMDAFSVSFLNLSCQSALAEQGLDPHSLEDLIEAAFFFENQLMGILEDDNSISLETYTGLSEEKLLRIIQSAVENICRLQSGQGQT